MKRAPNLVASRTAPRPVAASLQKLGLTQRALCRATGLSRSAVSRICAHDEWPLRDTVQARQLVTRFLREQKKLAPASSQLAGADFEVPETEIPLPFL